VSWVADTPLASVSFTVKLDVPASAGVPDSTPVEGSSVIPAAEVVLRSPPADVSRGRR
jgi:hypothetical protein